MTGRNTTRNFSLLAAAAMVALAAAAPSEAAARGHHGIHRAWGAYAFAPWQFPRNRYVGRFRYYDRFGSNLNPDRQMVGIGE